VLPKKAIFWSFEPVMVFGDDLVIVDINYSLIIVIAVTCLYVYPF
jgi:hypothetical protein